MSPTSGWSFWIDRGGTFTDVVARDPRGDLHVRKLLSEDPAHYRDAPIQAIRELLGLAPGTPIPAEVLAGIRMGTTVATNALLERRGEPVCLVTTAGCEDLLAIGTQARPELFALEIRKPEPLVARVIGVDESVTPTGTVERAPDLRRLRAELRAAREAGIGAVAVVFKNAYAAPAHERRVGALARELGFAHVGLSHEVVREIHMTGRGDTTTADAYLSPILRAYVERIAGQLPPGVSLRFLQSNGGLADAAHFSGKDAVLSGPAGGVVACAHVARQAGFPRVIAFDMGGTSTDVSRLDLAQGFERTYERLVAGVRIKAPMLDIKTIAAGGGSLLGCNGRRLTVGPDSAGADPGPLCYRRPGGRLALTDANLVLGRVQPELFPACFGPAADEPLDRARAEAALDELAERVRAASGQTLDARELAAGFVRIAVDAMARAIREISVARGYDPQDYALLCFGGAGAQHACALAESLGMDVVLIHPLGGVLSAYGMGLADVTHAGVRPLLAPLRTAGPAMASGYQQLEEAGRRAVLAQDIAREAVSFRRSADLRYRGVDAALNVPEPERRGPDAWEAAFAAAHRRLYGFERPGHPLEVVNLRVETVGATAVPADPARPLEPRLLGPGDAEAQVEMCCERVAPDGSRRLETLSTPVYRRAQLEPGCELTGPALVAEPVSTVVVDPGWRASCDARGNLVLRRVEEARPRERLSVARDPVLLEIMANLTMSIAEQMGATLRRVSLSVNIKERLDFSCALFDREGALVANAPHIPVHLGAMGASVRAVLRARTRPDGTCDLQPGDVLLSNDPYHGGSHLPDITVITPVFLEGRRAFFVASRGHHADVGGIVPGSMPPFSRSIEEEGVRLHNVLLVRDGRLRAAELRERLAAGDHPVRGIDERLADLEAQVAANAVGVRLLEEMVARYGLAVLQAYMGHLQDDAAAAMREAIAGLPDGEATFFDHLDDGARIAVRIAIAGEQARVDFAGTDPVLSGNLNAPRAVVQAAVLYVFRTLVPRPIPLNAGCFRPLEIRVPAGSLLDPRPPAAVVGGNVETSQRIVDVLYGALGKLGAAQGTMNNLTFGNTRFGYYETICGGAGAGLGFDGAAAVHTHMTNTRITDPEVLELRFPVVLRRFAIRRGSGGAGVFRGGDGVVRELEFREAMQCAILSERRAVAPYGAHGAGPGRRGRNLLLRALPGGGRRVHELPGKVRLSVEPGDRLRLETPGGGGYDPSPREWGAMRPATARRLFRDERYAGPTPAIALGHVQANLVVLPAAQAEAFAAYCRANPGPCPLLERLEPGSWTSRLLAPGADLRCELPRYRVHTRAGWRELLDLRPVWNEDAVAFLLGCSFSAEETLLAGGVPVRHVEEGRNVPMYRTRRRTRAAGPFQGELVVTMRPVPRAAVARATELTRDSWHSHGAPVHVGDVEALGIADLDRPDWGDAVTVRPGEVPVFWACGVTSQVAVDAALQAGAVEQVFTHAPGHMFIADRRNAELSAR